MKTETDLQFLEALRYCFRASKEYSSQKQLALAAKVSQGQLSEMLDGKKLGSTDARERISQAFGFNNLFEFLRFGKEVRDGKHPFFIDRAAEPFPRYQEIMRLPVKDRPQEIIAAAAEANGFMYIRGLLGDDLWRGESPTPKMLQRYLDGETTEAQLFHDADRYFKKRISEHDKELKRRGLI